MRITLKNLWKRRKQNAWICVELVLVSVVSWFVIDPLFVIVYNTFWESDGYDADRLCILTTRVKNQQLEEVAENMEVIKMKLKNMDGVESVSLTYERCFPNGDGMGISSFFGVPDDTAKWFCASMMILHSGEDMYKTMGLKVLDGNTDEEGEVITQSLAMALFGRTDVVGATINEYHNFPSMVTPEQIRQYRIAAVVEDVRMDNMVNCRFCVFRSRDKLLVSDQSELLVRLKEGVDAAAFCARLRSVMQRELSSGSLFVCKAQTMDELVDFRLRFQNVTGSIRRYISLVIFFMVNLCLGTIGTFWLQTRKRREEIGIMRSFGASKQRIMQSFLLEGFVLTTLCHLLGCALFLQYAVVNGLSVGLFYFGDLSLLQRIGDTWLNHFVPHFLAVGSLIYFILLMTVTAGIAIPVWHSSRQKPVEALQTS